jgi:choline dehydrogenase
VRVPPRSYAPAVRCDVVVVGGGTAGCVLAARLSENPERQICLLEAGPDYGRLANGRWPSEVLDARLSGATHLWEPGADDGRTLGGKVLGGSSSVNACMVVQGTPADYDEWGVAWSYEVMAPHLARARAMLRTAPANTRAPGPFHAAFVDAARALAYPAREDVDDPNETVGVGSYPANVVGGTRWNAALAYLDGCRGRPNLVVVPDMLVDRLELRNARVAGAIDVRGRLVEADTVVLAAGAYFSPAILLRSGIGPEASLREHGISPASVLPVGERLLDHCGATVTWSPSDALHADTHSRARSGELYSGHAVLKAASSTCVVDSWDLHLVPWIARVDERDRYEANVMVFHMKPRSHGRVTLRTRNPADPPQVDRGFLSDPTDLGPIVEGLELARALATTEPLDELLADELRPAETPVAEHVRSTVRGYFHPAGTCAIGEVVDDECGVLGVDGLRVVDASVMPTIPRANTNLTTAAIAERIAASI